MSKLYALRTIVLAAGGALFLAACAVQSGPTLTAPDALEKARTGEISLIDIRTPREWRQTGIAEGAIPLDMTSKTFVQQILTTVDGNKDAPIAIICRTGNRTTYVQKALQEQGFTQVYNVKEGMAGSAAGPGWVRRGLPVEACQTC